MTKRAGAVADLMKGRVSVRRIGVDLNKHVTKLDCIYDTQMKDRWQQTAWNLCLPFLPEPGIRSGGSGMQVYIEGPPASCFSAKRNCNANESTYHSLKACWL